MFYNTLQNAIINGGFNFFQRNLNYTGIAHTNYIADRWKYAKSGTFVHNTARSTDVPTTAITNYSMLLTVTTAQTVAGGIGLCGFSQTIEGNFASRLYGKKIALAFWVKSSKVGTYCVSLQNSASNRSLIKEYTVSAANTWERKIIRISHDSTGTWLKDTGAGIFMFFLLGGNSTVTAGTADIWSASGTAFGTSNQVNHCDTIGATFQLSEVVMVEDNTDQSRIPNFVYAGRDYTEEFVLAQRYFEKSYDLDTPPATITANGRLGDNGGGNGVSSPVMVIFNAQKRVTPVMSIYSDATGAIGNVSVGGSNFASPVTTGIGLNGVVGPTLSSTANVLYSYHYTAECDF